MITRFRLETDGISHEDCLRQLEEAAAGLIDIDGGNREDWEITDNVSWLDGDVARARVVMKLRNAPA